MDFQAKTLIFSLISDVVLPWSAKFPNSWNGFFEGPLMTDGIFTCVFRNLKKDLNNKYGG